MARDPEDGAEVDPLALAAQTPLPVADRARLGDLESQLLAGMRAGAFCAAEHVLTGVLSETEKVMLLDMVDLVRSRAVTPISDFHVGAVGVTEAGNLCAGVNLEFPGMPLSASVHAEQYLTVVSLQGGDRLRLVAVSAAPCGHCRQFVSELPQADNLEFIFRGYIHPVSLDTILPHRFRPEDLQEASHLAPCAPLQGPFAFRLPSADSVAQESSLADHSSGTASLTAHAAERLAELDAPWRRAAAAAFEAARASYAPYTRSHAGLCLLLRDGALVRGFAIESAAYNPTLSPLHVALIALHSGGGSWQSIASAVLVERPSAPVSYESLARDLLRCIAPKATLLTLHIEAAAASN